MAVLAMAALEETVALEWVKAKAVLLHTADPPRSSRRNSSYIQRSHHRRRNCQAPTQSIAMSK